MMQSFSRTALALVILTIAITACGQPIPESVPGDAIDDMTPTPEVNDKSEQVKQTEGAPLPTGDPKINEDQPVIDGSLFWSEAIDEPTGLRFAVPCFWEVNLPDLDPGGLGAISIRNYNEEFVIAHPRGHISDEEGAIKIDMVYIQPSSWDLPSDVSLEEFAVALTDDEISELIAMEEILVNNQRSLLVTNLNKEDDSTYRYHLFGLSKHLILLFSVWPRSAFDSPDVQGVLESIAFNPDVDVHVPQIFPMDPPLGVPAACLKGFGTTSDHTDLSSKLSCKDIEAGSAEALACGIQDALLARNMQALASLMSDPFTIGYWGSESGWASPMDMVNELSRNRLPTDTSGLTFTTDRNLFPSLQGMPPERMFGPDVDVALIIYSEGWGSDGQGAALLYIVQSGVEYSWDSMVYSNMHFDK